MLTDSYAGWKVIDALGLDEIARPTEDMLGTPNTTIWTCNCRNKTQKELNRSGHWTSKLSQVKLGSCLAWLTFSHIWIKLNHTFFFFFFSLVEFTIPKTKKNKTFFFFLFLNNTCLFIAHYRFTKIFWALCFNDQQHFIIIKKKKKKEKIRSKTDTQRMKSMTYKWKIEKFFSSN